MSTSSTSIIGSSSPTNSSSSANISGLGISETGFLQLITAQLQDQNPLSPADPTQFLTQLEGLSEVDSLNSMKASMTSSQLTNGASLIGKYVLASGSSAYLSSGSSIDGAVSAPSGASNLTVSVKNSNGVTVDSFAVTPASSGLTYFAWDGSTSSGGTAPAGTYTLSVNATVNGTTQSVNPQVVSEVQSVTMDSSTSALDLNTTNGTVALSDVTQVL